MSVIKLNFVFHFPAAAAAPAAPAGTGGDCPDTAGSSESTEEGGSPAASGGIAGGRAPTPPVTHSSELAVATTGEGRGTLGNGTLGGSTAAAGQGAVLPPSGPVGVRRARSRSADEGSALARDGLEDDARPIRRRRAEAAAPGNQAPLAAPRPLGRQGGGEDRTRQLPAATLVELPELMERFCELTAPRAASSSGSGGAGSGARQDRGDIRE